MNKSVWKPSQMERSATGQLIYMSMTHSHPVLLQFICYMSHNVGNNLWRYIVWVALTSALGEFWALCWSIQAHFSGSHCCNWKGDRTCGHLMNGCLVFNDRKVLV